VGILFFKLPSIYFSMISMGNKLKDNILLMPKEWSVPKISTPSKVGRGSLFWEHP
jgi:hypothetical protein